MTVADELMIERDTLRAIVRRLITQGAVKPVTDRDGDHALETGWVYGPSVKLSPDEAELVQQLLIGEKVMR